MADPEVKKDGSFITLLLRYILLFVLASFIGWLYEIICVRIWLGVFVDRGVLHLPMCPIYGFGMLTLLAIFRKVKDPLLLFLGSALVTTVIELAASYILEYCFHLSLWSYAGWPLTFQDRISAISSGIFGLMSVLFICLVKPPVDKLFASRYKSYAAAAVGVLTAFCVIWELHFYL